MKVFWAILLVLTMASAANALFIQFDGIQTDNIEIAAGTTSMITIVSEDTSSWLGYIIIEESDAGTLDNVNILDAAGNMAYAAPYTEAGWGSGYELIAGMSPGGVPAIAIGPQFSMEFSDGVIGQTARVSLFLDPDYTTPIASVNISIIPEPVTITLLGLGCLFLRLRK